MLPAMPVVSAMMGAKMLGSEVFPVSAQGQSKVPAAQAQIIFSSLPLWSALFAALLLHGEKMGIYGWLGGLIILLAGIVASRK